MTADNIGDWLEETHSSAFELRRHFFRRFFDSELVSTPGQWQVVAIGAFAIVASLSIVVSQAYFHKYRLLLELDSPEPYRMAALADHLFFITLSMLLAGLLTTLQWPSLFPGLRDYLALASLPVRTHEIFTAKFTALAAFAGIFIVGINVLPSLMLPAVMAGRYLTGGLSHVISLFVSMSLAAFFVFFLLVAVQGILLNVTPVGLFPRVSLFVQGALFIVLVCAAPFTFSIPGLQKFVDQRPELLTWAPPVWFLGLDQAMLSNPDPLAARLSRVALAAVGAAATAAVGAYLWSYRRHKVRILETPVQPKRDRGVAGRWLDGLVDRVMPDPRQRAIFAFVTATLSRSRQHRMVLTAFVAVAIAIVFESFVSLVLGRGFRGFSVLTFALRQAAVSAPLALSLFVLAGYRYLFRLPVELRANWIFRMNEGGNREAFLGALDRFVTCFGVIPVAAVTLPVEMQILGAPMGIAAAAIALLPSLTLQELLLYQFQRIPFTSSYLPGRRPLIEVVVIYTAAVIAYVSAGSAIIVAVLDEPAHYVTAFGILLAIWARIRKARLQDWEMGRLEFEELPEPAVHTLKLNPD